MVNRQAKEVMRRIVRRIVPGIPRFAEIRENTIRDSTRSGIYDCPICGKIVKIEINRKTGLANASCVTCNLRDEIPLEEMFGNLTTTHDVFSKLCDRIYAARITYFEMTVPE